MEERNSLAHELHDSLAQTLASLRFQVKMLEDALKKTRYNKTRAAELLGISFRSLRYKLKKFNIE